MGSSDNQVFEFNDFNGVTSKSHTNGHESILLESLSDGIETGSRHIVHLLRRSNYRNPDVACALFARLRAYDYSTWTNHYSLSTSIAIFRTIALTLDDCAWESASLREAYRKMLPCLAMVAWRLRSLGNERKRRKLDRILSECFSKRNTGLDTATVELMHNKPDISDQEVAMLGHLCFADELISKQTVKGARLISSQMNEVLVRFLSSHFRSNIPFDHLELGQLSAVMTHVDEAILDAIFDDIKVAILRDIDGWMPTVHLMFSKCQSILDLQIADTLLDMCTERLSSKDLSKQRLASDCVVSIIASHSREETVWKLEHQLFEKFKKGQSNELSALTGEDRLVVIRIPGKVSSRKPRRQHCSDMIAKDLLTSVVEIGGTPGNKADALRELASYLQRSKNPVLDIVLMMQKELDFEKEKPATRAVMLEILYREMCKSENENWVDHATVKTILDAKSSWSTSQFGVDRLEEAGRAQQIMARLMAYDAVQCKQAAQNLISKIEKIVSRSFGTLVSNPLNFVIGSSDSMKIDSSCLARLVCTTLMFTDYAVAKRLCRQVEQQQFKQVWDIQQKVALMHAAVAVMSLPEGDHATACRFAMMIPLIKFDLSKYCGDTDHSGDTGATPSPVTMEVEHIGYLQSLLKFLGSMYRARNGQQRMSKSHIDQATRRCLEKQFSVLLEALVADTDVDQMVVCNSISALCAPAVPGTHQTRDLIMKAVLSALIRPDRLKTTDLDYDIWITKDGELADKEFLAKLIDDIAADLKKSKKESKTYTYKEQQLEIGMRLERIKAGNFSQLSEKHMGVYKKQLEIEKEVRKGIMKAKHDVESLALILENALDMCLLDVFPELYNAILETCCAHMRSRITHSALQRVIERIFKHLNLNPVEITTFWRGVACFANKQCIPETYTWAIETATSESDEMKAVLALQSLCSDKEYHLHLSNLLIHVRFIQHILISPGKRLNEEKLVFVDTMQCCLDKLEDNLMDKTFVFNLLKPVMFALKDQRFPHCIGALMFLGTCLIDRLWPKSKTYSTAAQVQELIQIIDKDSEDVKIVNMVLTAVGRMENPDEQLPEDTMNFLTEWCWILSFYPDEPLKNLASELWSRCHRDQQSMLAVSVRWSGCRDMDLSISAGKAVKEILSRNPELHQVAVDLWMEQFNRSVKENAEMKQETTTKDNFVFEESLEDSKKQVVAKQREWNLVGMCHALNAVLETSAEVDVSALLKFIVPSCFYVEPDKIATLMMAAAVKVVHIAEKHKRGEMTKILSFLETKMSQAPHGKDHDYFRMCVVILIGTAVRHFSADKEKIKSVIEQLINVLGTPSALVQESAATCLSSLVENLNRNETKLLADRFVSLVFSGKSYAERKGASFGLAGIISGVNVFALQQFNVLKKISGEIQNKSSPSSREGALMMIESLIRLLKSSFEIYIVDLLPNILVCLSDGDATVRRGAEQCGKVLMSRLSDEGIALLLPSIQQGIESDKWRTKCGSVDLLGAMAYCDPKKLSMHLPTVAPKLIEAMNDSHVKVQHASLMAIQKIMTVVKNPDVQEVMPKVISALQNPISDVDPCINALLKSDMLAHLDAASMALILPIAMRGLKEGNMDTRVKCGEVLVRICSQCPAKDLNFYSNDLFALTRSYLFDPTPEVREKSAKVLAFIVKRIDEDAKADIDEWLDINLRNPKLSMNRVGAAQGICEIAAITSEADLLCHARRYLSSAFAESSDSFALHGYIVFFTFVANRYPQAFTVIIEELVSVLLNALADEAEFVRTAAYSLGQVLVKKYVEKCYRYLLPNVEEYMFHARWKIRLCSATLMGDMILSIAGGANEVSQKVLYSDRSLVAVRRVLGEVTTDSVICKLFIVGYDSVAQVAQAANRVWRVLIANTTAQLLHSMPKLLRTAREKLETHDADSPVTKMVARALGDLVRRLGSDALSKTMDCVDELIVNKGGEGKKCACLCVEDIFASAPKDVIICGVERCVAMFEKLMICEDDEGREAAAKSFEALHRMITTARALDYVVIPQLELLRGASFAEGANRAKGLAALLRHMDCSFTSQVYPMLFLFDDFNVRHLGILLADCPNLDGHWISKVIRIGVKSSRTDDGRIDESGIANSAESFLAMSRSDGGVSEFVMVILTLCQEYLDEDNILSLEIAVRMVIHLLKGVDANELIDKVASPLVRVVFQIAVIKHHQTTAYDAMAEMFDAALHKFSNNELCRCVQYMNDQFGSVACKEPKVFMIPGFYLSKKMGKQIIWLYKKNMQEADIHTRENSVKGLMYYIRSASAVAYESELLTLVGPLIRLLMGCYSNRLRYSMLNTIAMLLRKSPAKIRPFLPQMVPTFLRSMTSMSTTTRCAASRCMVSALPMKPRFDNLFKDFMAIFGCPMENFKFEDLDDIMDGSQQSTTYAYALDTVMFTMLSAIDIIRPKLDDDQINDIDDLLANANCCCGERDVLIKEHLDLLVENVNMIVYLLGCPDIEYKMKTILADLDAPKMSKPIITAVSFVRFMMDDMRPIVSPQLNTLVTLCMDRLEADSHLHYFRLIGSVAVGVVVMESNQLKDTGALVVAELEKCVDLIKQVVLSDSNPPNSSTTMVQTALGFCLRATRITGKWNRLLDFVFTAADNPSCSIHDAARDALIHLFKLDDLEPDIGKIQVYVRNQQPNLTMLHERMNNWRCKPNDWQADDARLFDWESNCWCTYS